MFDKKVFANRRKRILKAMKSNSVMVINSAQFKSKNADMDYIYRQDSNFYYLTGLNIDGCTLILSKNKNCKEFLFIKRNTTYQEIWLGKRMDIEQASNISNIENVFYYEDKEQYIDSLVSNADYLYLDYKPSIKSQMDYSLYNANKYKKRFPNLIAIMPLNQLLHEKRIIKDKDEIRAIEKAIDITKQSIINVLKKAKPGMYEYELRAEIEYIYMKNGVMLPAFNSIVAAGKNAAILHYTALDSKINKNDLVLLDIGAEYLNYSADISRTFPINGKFAGKKRDLYSALLDIQEKMIDSVKPGIPTKSLQKKTIFLITKLLKSFKYIKNNDDYFPFYPHGIGHQLGLDTHDVSNKRNTILKPGMIITIEPGIYIKKEGIGIRIEDDILITNKGKRNLSKDIPKHIKDIEKIMGA